MVARLQRLFWLLIIFYHNFMGAKWISFADPVGSLVGATEEILDTTNVYRQRQNELIKIQAFLDTTLPSQEADAIAILQESQNDIVATAEKLKAEMGGAFDEKLMAMVNNFNFILDEQRAEWSGYRNDLLKYIDFLKTNKDLIDEHEANRIFIKIESINTLSLEELAQFEKKLADVEQEKEVILVRRQGLEAQRDEDRYNLEILRKEQADLIQKKQLKTAVDGFKFGKLTEDRFRYQLEKSFLQAKGSLLRTKIERAESVLKILDREFDLLKAKSKNILEPAYKKAQAKLLVTEIDLEDQKRELNSEKIKVDEKLKDLNLQSIEIKQKFDKVKKKLDECDISLKKMKHDNDEKGEMDETAARKRDHFSLEILKLKYSFEADLLNQQKVLLDLARKSITLEFDIAKFACYKVEAYHFFSSNPGGLSQSLKHLRDIDLPDLMKKYESAVFYAAGIESFLEKVSSVKKTELKERREQLFSMKNSIFLGQRTLYQDIFDRINDAENLLNELIKKFYESKLVLLNFEKKRRDLLDNLDGLRKKIADTLGLRNIYSRSSKAISFEDLRNSFDDGILYINKFVVDGYEKINPFFLIPTFFQFLLKKHLIFFLMLLVFFLLWLALRGLILELHRRLSLSGLISLDRIRNKYFVFLLAVWNLILYKFNALYLWMLIHIFIQYKIPFWGILLYRMEPFYISLFYLVSIFFIQSIIQKFLRFFEVLNERSNYLFFTERTAQKNFFLLSSLMYLTGIFFPLFWAVSSYSSIFNTSSLTSVFFAAYSLLVMLILFFFLDRENIIRFIPEHLGGVFLFLRKFLETFYYFIFTFFFCVYIISNPYIGYTNLALYLLYTVPASICVISLAYFLQSSGRTLMQNFFLAESDLEGEFVEKFENARICYGIYIIISFSLVCLLTFAFVSKIWFGQYNLLALWHNLSETWTIPIGEKHKLGFVQLFIFSVILFCGYFISVFFDRIVLRKLFDIFKIEQGLENSISKILQYILIILSIVTAFIAINLLDFVKYFLLALGIGVTLGMRDQISDIFAGILILLERHFEMGHFVEFEDIRGTVHVISIRSTTIRTMRNFFISIPNRLLISKPVVNWGAGRVAVGMELTVRVSYGPDPAHVCNLIRQVIYENPSVLKIPMAIVRLDEFSEYGMVFFMRAFVSARKVRDQWDIAAGIRAKIINIFRANRITIAYPNTILHLNSTARESKEGVVNDGVFTVKFEDISQT